MMAEGLGNIEFWATLDSLVASHPLVIDRPADSTHPRYPNMVYPLNYGYLDGTRASDGGGIDTWIGSLSARRVTGVICTVDLLKADAEIKLLLGCTSDEMATALAVHCSGAQAGLLLVRPN